MESPLPASVRESRGPVLFFARETVEAAKSQSPSVVVIGSGEDAAGANGVVQLIALLWQGRTGLGAAAIAAMEEQGEDGTLSQAAGRLEISEQALSQRLQAANWRVEQRTKTAVLRSLSRADAQQQKGSV